jgi:hypothetical protein
MALPYAGRDPISSNPVSGQSSADQRQFLHFGSRTKASHAVPGTEMLDCSHQSSWGKQLTAGAPNDQIQFAVSISTDRDGFMRYTCPSCGLDFKTQIDPADLQWLLTSYCRRAGLEIGARGSDSSSPHCFWCPYCGDRAESRQMLTEETVTYLKRIVHREYVLPQLSRMFAGLADSFGGQKQSGGLLSLSIELKHSRSVLPVRPMHGPEPADLKIVTLLCCNKKIKISEYWSDAPFCSFCGTRVVLV